MVIKKHKCVFLYIMYLYCTADTYTLYIIYSHTFIFRHNGHSSKCRLSLYGNSFLNILFCDDQTDLDKTKTHINVSELGLVLIIAGGSLSVVVVGSVNCHRDLLVQQVERDLIPTDIQNIFLENPKHYFNNLTINYLLLVHAESPAGDPRAWFCTGD